MVWGLFQPNGGGDYSPDGDHISRRNGLRKYFHEHMTDDERSKYSENELEYFYQVSRKFNEDLGPLQPQEMPSDWQTVKSHKTLGSLILMTNALLAVDEPLKNLIENLEPDVHQFWPMKIVMPKGKEYPVPYYGMVIRQFIDSFRPEQSVEGSWQKRPAGYVVVDDTKRGVSKLAFDKQAFESAHLWREKNLNDPKICISDTLQKAIADAGLGIWRHYPMKEV